MICIFGWNMHCRCFLLCAVGVLRDSKSVEEMSCRLEGTDMDQVGHRGLALATRNTLNVTQSFGPHLRLVYQILLLLLLYVYEDDLIFI